MGWRGQEIAEGIRRLMHQSTRHMHSSCKTSFVLQIRSSTSENFLDDVLYKSNEQKKSSSVMFEPQVQPGIAVLLHLSLT